MGIPGLTLYHLKSHLQVLPTSLSITFLSIGPYKPYMAFNFFYSLSLKRCNNEVILSILHFLDLQAKKWNFLIQSCLILWSVRYKQFHPFTSHFWGLGVKGWFLLLFDYIYANFSPPFSFWSNRSTGLARICMDMLQVGPAKLVGRLICSILLRNFHCFTGNLEFIQYLHHAIV